MEDNLAFTMELELRRTECGKLDKDIDNRPFQESPELNNVRHTADPSATQLRMQLGTEGEVEQMTVPFLGTETK